MDVAFIAAREAGTEQWVMPNGAEAAMENQEYPEWWAWPRARGLSLTEPAVKFKRPWEGVCVCVYVCLRVQRD